MDGAPGHLDLERGDAYGRSFGDVYDHWYDGVTDAEATAGFVAARHPGGPVLELGVGTGRLGRPLSDLGLTVVGLDASAEMLDRCPRGDRGGAGGAIRPILADMRSLPFADRPSVGQARPNRAPFGSALIAFNTLFNLATDAQQAALLTDLAQLVDPRGVVIVEMLDLTALLDGPGRSIGLRRTTDDPGRIPLVVTATQLDGDTQCLWGQHVELSDAGVTIRPWMLHWVTPDQLDAMAAGAGLRLDQRFGSWDGAPVTPGGPAVISVYRPTAPPGPARSDDRANRSPTVPPWAR